jgi:hypothetical protein
MKKFMLLAAVLLLTGCATQKFTFNSGEAAAYLATHRDRPAAINSAISTGNLAQGMNEEEVQICWGKPDSVMTQYLPNQEITTWSYTEPRIIASSFRRSLWSYEVAKQAIFTNGVLREWRVIKDLQ